MSSIPGLQYCVFLDTKHFQDVIFYPDLDIRLGLDVLFKNERATYFCLLEDLEAFVSQTDLLLFTGAWSFPRFDAINAKK